MKRHIYAYLIFTFSISYAQIDTSKFNLIWNGEDSILIRKPSKAGILFENGNYELSINEYKKTFAGSNEDDDALINIAAAYSLTKQIDSAFIYLNKAGRIDSSGSILRNPDLYNLIHDKRWSIYEKEILKNIELKTKKKYFYPAVTLQLWKMHLIDQAFYRQISKLEENYLQYNFKIDSIKIDSLWKLKGNLNFKNVKDLERIIKKYGWPKRSVFGSQASSTAFLVIQHSNIKNQKKYLPTLKSLCQINEAEWQDYALMKDRILTSEEKPQLYGSQVRFNNDKKKYEVFPILDEEHVDERRKKVGLPPLKFYLQEFGIEYIYKKVP